MNGMLGTAAKRLAIQTISGLLVLKPDDVFSCTFDEATHLWQLKLSNGQVYKLKRQATAKAILSMSPSLAQVRQDCIINLDYLLCIENYTLRCIFSPPFDHEEITVSRRCYKAVRISWRYCSNREKIGCARYSLCTPSSSMFLFFSNSPIQ